MIGIQYPWRKKVVGTPRQINIGLSLGGELVGRICGMTDGEATYLTDLYVREIYRGDGNGTKLMNEFLEKAKGTTIILLTTEATEFYKKFGFEERTAMVRKPTE